MENRSPTAGCRRRSFGANSIEGRTPWDGRSGARIPVPEAIGENPADGSSRAARSLVAPVAGVAPLHLRGDHVPRREHRGEDGDRHPSVRPAPRDRTVRRRLAGDRGTHDRDVAIWTPALWLPPHPFTSATTVAT